MKLSQLISSTKYLLKNNSTTILSALSVSGVVGTVYLTRRATLAEVAIVERDQELRRDEDGDVPYLGRMHYPKLVWKSYIPVALTATTTVVCIVAAQKSGNRRTAAAQAAFAVTERAFSEYRDKVVEEIGEHKERTLRDKLAQDRVDKKPPSESMLVMSDAGKVIFRENYSGRDFMCDMETVRKAVNELNARLLREDYATLDDFYHILGLPQTAQSPYFGWKTPRLMEVSFSTTISMGKPVIVFDYNYVSEL